MKNLNFTINTNYSNQKDEAFYKEMIPKYFEPYIERKFFLECLF